MNSLGDVKLCAVGDCFRPSHARGWCKNHYENNRIYGSAVSIRHKAMAFVEEAISSSTDECITWPWGLNKNGYGRIHIADSRRLAHRYVCERVNGPHPKGRPEAAHGCGKPACINPRHLRWASHAENMADKIIHGTLLKGSQLPWATLDEESVRDILVTRANAINALATKYSVNPEVIRKIWSGKNWTWVGQ